MKSQKEIFYDVVKQNNGFIIDDYKNSIAKVTLKCEKNHTWTIGVKSILNGFWCPFCSGKRINIDTLLKIASDRGGKLLSLSIDNLNRSSKLKWQCANNHVFERTFNSIKCFNYWCSQCISKWTNEELCRSILEEIFHEKFIKFRLKDDYFQFLELDGFCEKLNIAFEHNGIQHYKEVKSNYIKFDFELIKKRDEKKYKLCADLGIKLIIIPQLFKIVKKDQIFKHLKSEFIRLNIDYPKDLNEEEILEKICIVVSTTNTISNKLLKRAEEYAKSKNGQMLSKHSINTNDRLKFKCKRGHIWEAYYNNAVNNGQWCKKCALTKYWFEKETYIEHYINKNMSINDISKKFNITKKVLYDLAKVYGISLKKERVSVDIEKIKNMIVSGDSINDIAIMYKTSSTTIRRKLKKYNK